jgi:magnesium transporter
MKPNEYQKESAGRVMIPKEKLPVFLQNKKISEIKGEFLGKLDEFEVCYYIYFINENEELVGVLSERELFQAPIDLVVNEIMNKKIIRVESYTDQEQVAILAIDRHLKAIPVVNKENKFLGVVPSRSIFNILHHEHVEDFLKSAGIHSLPAQTITGSVPFLVKVRIPWLILGLIGGLLAAELTEIFEAPLKEYFILAAFIPLIIYMADAIGTQTQTLFIRNLVMRKLNLRNYFLKETKVGLGISLILGILLFLISFLWLKTFFISLILGFSMFFTGLAAIFVPILIVWLLDKFKKDPAIGSGPLATILQDILSLAIYFSITSLLLKVFT